MRRIAVAVAAALAALAAAPAAAQPGNTPSGPAAAPAPADAAERVLAAGHAADAGDWAEVERLARPLADDDDATRADRAEAYRLLGLAAYHHGELARAESHFLAYLELELDGRLDPTLHAPELYRFFENVRAKHAAHLRGLRPRPRRSLVLNLLPPAGQFQNRQPVKGWVIAGLGVTLLATNLTTYVMLDRMCSDLDRTCEDGDTSRSGRARWLRRLNFAAGIGLIGVYVYGVYDGFRNYRRASRTVMVTPVGVADGVGVGVAGRF